MTIYNQLPDVTVPEIPLPVPDTKAQRHRRSPAAWLICGAIGVAGFIAEPYVAPWPLSGYGASEVHASVHLQPPPLPIPGS